MKSKPVRWASLILVLMAVIALWLSTLWFVPKLPALLPIGTDATAVVSFGVIGDMFGAINALFSGLALGAIALTLWLEARSRRESRKPLVVGGIDSGDVTIGRPEGKSGATILTLRVPVKLSNQSTDAALNVSGKLRMLLEPRTTWNIGLDGPLLREADQEAAFEIELGPKEWEPMLVELTSQRAVEMELTTIYRSLEGVNWKTIVVYRFFVRTTDQHYGLLDTVRNGTWSEGGVWQSDALVSVSAQIKQGSWDHCLH